MAIPWSGWESLGKPGDAELDRPFAQRNQDGRIEVFALAQGELFDVWQVFPNAGWSNGWHSQGRPSPKVSIQSHVVGTNADGRQEIFAIGSDRALWQKWQVSPNLGWSEWKTLGTPAKDVSLTGRLAAGKNQDGRQEVFAAASDGNIWQIWQTVPNGGWSHWGKLGAPSAGLRVPDRISVARNKDGRQELFAMGQDDALWHVWQVGPNVGWNAWESLGKPRDFQLPEPKDRDLTDPVVLRNADGHLEAFAPGNGAFCNRWQEAPNSSVWRHQGWNAKPKPAANVGLTWLDGALNREDRIEVIALADDGALWHAWQIDVAPNWSEWKSLGSPQAKIRETGRLAIGINQDRRLEVFLVGQDGAVWHTWQLH